MTDRRYLLDTNISPQKIEDLELGVDLQRRVVAHRVQLACRYAPDTDCSHESQLLLLRRHQPANGVP